MTFNIEFLGAVGGVTGSRTLVRFDGYQVLVDCGLFQGPKDIKQKNWDPLLVPEKTVAAVVLTHAHLDHSGFLPRFFRQGWRGPVYCSTGTADLLPVMLRDAAYLETEFANYANKTGYSNHKPALPLFTEEDVEVVLKHIKPLERNQWIQLAQDVSVRFINAGHIIGASILQFSLADTNGTKILTFSGDLGHERSLTIRPPDPISETDVLVVESTYGDRLHIRNDVVHEFSDVAMRTFKRGGVLVVPAFAVGRAQEILYIIRRAEDAGLIPKVPVLLDSPMSKVATKVFLNHPEDHKEGLEFSSENPEARFLPAKFETTISSDESLMACMRDGPMIVISAAGMLNGGRILHHLKSRLPHPENTILFCGYQAEGTKGRTLQDRPNNLNKLRIHHVEFPIEAEIATIASLSAHGDWQDITSWLGRMTKLPSHIFINHGDKPAMTQMIEHIKKVAPKSQVKALWGPEKISLF
jgi:metallo-beta-lactamase family protein